MDTHHSTKTTHYPAIVDWWVLIGAIFLLILLLSAIPVLLWHPETIVTDILGALGLILTCLYIIDQIFFTQYILDVRGLSIRSQLHTIFFPYRSMTSIRTGSTMSLISRGRHKRLGLSSNGLCISLTHSHWRTIGLSPGRRDQFLNQLLSNIDWERTTRTLHSKGEHRE